MDLSFTEEQEALVATAREFTRKEVIPKARHHDETGEFPREILKKAPGVVVQDDTAANSYPTPLTAAHKDAVFVGRIRNDSSNANGIAMWITSDNIRKGAALNALQIAEEMVARGLV